MLSRGWVVSPRSWRWRRLFSLVGCRVEDATLNRRTMAIERKSLGWRADAALLSRMRRLSMRLKRRGLVSMRLSRRSLGTPVEEALVLGKLHLKLDKRIREFGDLVLVLAEDLVGRTHESMM